MSWRETMLKLYYDEAGISLEMSRRAQKSKGVNKVGTYFSKNREMAAILGAKGGSVTKKNRKLTDAQVRKIRTSTKTTTELAAQYNIDSSYISLIKRGLRYRDVK